MRSKLENNSGTAWSTRTLSPACPAKPGHHICAWYFEIGYCNKSASNSPIERFRGHACVLTCLKLSSPLSIKCLHLCTMCKPGIGCAADNEHLYISSLTAALHVLSMHLHHVSPVHQLCLPLCSILTDPTNWLSDVHAWSLLAHHRSSRSGPKRANGWKDL